jgi:hypothetical protein
VYNDTVLGRLLHLCHDNRALIAVILVELGELLEGIVAGNVGVEDEEGRVVLSEDVFGELEGTGGTEGLGLDGEGDGDAVLLLVLHIRLFVRSVMPLSRYTNGLQRLGHDFRAVVDSKDDICDTSIGKGLDLVLNHRLVRELDERLGVGEGLQWALVLPFAWNRGARRATRRTYERPQTGSKPSDENDGCLGC